MSLSPSFATSVHAFFAAPPVASRLTVAPMRLGHRSIDAFGPALTLGQSTPPSVFVIYNQQGASSALGPNPRVASTVAAVTDGVPSSVLYSRLGNTVQQIQLNERNSRLVNVYSIGYQLLV